MQISYFVCATPRSGSSLLCEALKNSGLAGDPREYFWRDDEKYWSEKWRVSTFADYLAEVLQHGTSDNGVFGAKMMMGGGYFTRFVNSLRQLPTYEGQSIPTLLTDIFPNLHFVWMTRRNKVRQAVSWWKAIQTGVWVKSEDRSLVESVNIEFKFEAIDQLVQELVMREASWQEYFAAVGIRPFTVVYEDLVSAYEETVRQILTYLGVLAPANLVFGPRKLRQQADAVSEEWVGRYRILKEKEWSEPQWEYVAEL